VESLLFGTLGDVSVLVTGSLDGTVNVWDLSTQASRLAVSVGAGVVKLSWRRKSNGADSCSGTAAATITTSATGQLLVATLGGVVRLLDIREGKVLADCSGHSKAILDFDQSRSVANFTTYFICETIPFSTSLYSAFQGWQHGGHKLG